MAPSCLVLSNYLLLHPQYCVFPLLCIWTFGNFLEIPNKLEKHLESVDLCQAAHFPTCCDSHLYYSTYRQE